MAKIVPFKQINKLAKRGIQKRTQGDSGAFNKKSKSRKVVRKGTKRG